MPRWCRTDQVTKGKSWVREVRMVRSPVRRSPRPRSPRPRSPRPRSPRPKSPRRKSPLRRPASPRWYRPYMTRCARSAGLPAVVRCEI
ncbi:hypothetical protein E2C01_003790 [Portunus trituberculatus]|uniref:Uncharacterized protein n=1 Tax=Portunus trituberculatus TaxID=210409 RepID=A0A5B7CN19_PORTR|nr:hypothetical protein [Portunus trituberculatus]